MSLCPLTVVKTPATVFTVRTEMLPRDVPVTERNGNRDEFVLNVSEEEGEKIKKFENLRYAQAAAAAAFLHWNITDEQAGNMALTWSKIFEPKIVMEPMPPMGTSEIQKIEAQEPVPMAHIVPLNKKEVKSINSFPFILPCMPLTAYQMMAYEFYCVSRDIPISFKEDSSTSFSGAALQNSKGVIDLRLAWEKLNKFCFYLLPALDLTQSYITGRAISSSMFITSGTHCIADPLEIVVVDPDHFDQIAYKHYRVFASNRSNVTVKKVDDKWRITGSRMRPVIIRLGKHQDVATNTHGAERGFYDHRGFVMMASAVVTGLQGYSPNYYFKDGEDPREILIGDFGLGNRKSENFVRNINSEELEIVPSNDEALMTRSGNEIVSTRGCYIDRDSSGLIGERGSVGLVGERGSVGLVRGSVGLVGERGSVGLVGERGPVGPIGPSCWPRH